MGIHADDDFVGVVDGLQPLVLLRRGGPRATLAGARLVRQETREPDPSGGSVASADSLWDIPWPSDEPLPALGDRFSSESGVCGTLLSFERRSPGLRLRCLVRDLRVSCRLTDLVDVQQAVWEGSGSSQEISEWASLRPATPARVQPTSVEVDAEQSPPASSNAYSIFLDIDIVLDHNYRIVDSRGDIYRIDRFLRPERIDALPLVEATKLSQST